MTRPSRGVQQPASRPFDFDPDPSGGYTLTPPRQFLFFDYRHIKPGDLRWMAPNGQELPLVNPPEPRVEARADAEGVAQGIRLMAHKAVTESPIAGLPNRIIRHEDKYRT